MNSYALISLASNGAAIKMWDVMGKGYRKTTKKGQTHELKYMTHHLRSIASPDDEDTKQEKDDATQIQIMSEIFRKEALRLQADTVEQLKKRLTDVKEGKLMSDMVSTKDKQKLANIKRKAAIQQKFLNLTDQDYLYVVSTIKEFLSPEFYALMTEKRFDLELVCDTFEVDLCD